MCNRSLKVYKDVLIADIFNVNTRLCKLRTSMGLMYSYIGSNIM